LGNIVEKRDNDLNAWIKSINDYLDFRYSDNEISKEDSRKITINCVNSFSKIAEMCIENGKFKDKWDYEYFHLSLYGPELIVKSLKTQCDYRIGLDNKGIYLSTDFRHNENLRYMSDEFWKILLKLSDMEGFAYKEYEFVSDKRRKEFPELFSTNKSMIYRILRKYIFDSTEANPRLRSGSIGEIRLQWTAHKGFEYLIKDCCFGFKMMYQLNYDLWKIEDLKNKKGDSNK